MPEFDNLEKIFIITAFLIQVVLIIHFALRKWRFYTAMRYGPIVYALSIVALSVSVLILLGGKPWPFWIGGFIYFLWAIYGYVVEYVKKIQWRTPIYWPILGPYVFLYLATIMFYWFPLGTLYRPLWYAYAVLFVASTLLNLFSHKGPTHQTPSLAS